ncbi:hypothetical protein BDV27DRAFT_73003 [Aspergillus caelatus]|uniref:Uncharacterized protein n=1 Tax=Aspergillus caelatus TaxID=61420 RepID=A0A5N7ABZ9_9EURO|nr:uncharacterized protein BDV27DRAFT_73003 [Aspergillus caelatus]KAE8367421.1 hypothetical protein BDV27DRAFT_73003 [Aspergillus caelatus]
MSLGLHLSSSSRSPRDIFYILLGVRVLLGIFRYVFNLTCQSCRLPHTFCAV